MNNHLASASRLILLPLVFAVLPALAVAQQVPVTGQMMDEGGSASSPAASARAATRTVAATPAAPSAVSTMPLPTAPEESTYIASTPPVAAAPRQLRAHATVIGETTQNLLQMQADGSEAGKPLPMLGAEASASYARYLKSFNHDIPEFYKTTVGKDSNSSSGGE